MSYELFFIPAIMLLAWYSWKTQPKNLPLDWSTLSTFMRNPCEYEMILNPNDRGLNADFGIQFRSVRESVMYFVTERADEKVETLDLNRKGYAGFIVTFFNGEVGTLQRIAGRTSRHPQLQPQQHTALEGLLKRVRAETKKHRH